MFHPAPHHHLFFCSAPCPFPSPPPSSHPTAHSPPPHTTAMPASPNHATILPNPLAATVLGYWCFNVVLLMTRMTRVTTTATTTVLFSQVCTSRATIEPTTPKGACSPPLTCNCSQPRADLGTTLAEDSPVVEASNQSLSGPTNPAKGSLSLARHPRKVCACNGRSLSYVFLSFSLRRSYPR